jgi:hypothetical protein
LNGDKQDIIYNTESPIICDSCRAEFKRRQADNNILSKIENELKRIRKPIIKRVEIFIKQYPLVSMCITGLSAITLNLIASALWTLFTSNSFKGFLTIVFHTFNKN